VNPSLGIEGKAFAIAKAGGEAFSRGEALALPIGIIKPSPGARL